MESVWSRERLTQTLGHKLINSLKNRGEVLKRHPPGTYIDRAPGGCLFQASKNGNDNPKCAHRHTPDENECQDDATRYKHFSHKADGYRTSGASRMTGWRRVTPFSRTCCSATIF
jgi:hypothetical protein